MKTCTKCKETKPATLDFFFKQLSGLRSQCKDCLKAIDRNPYLAKWRQTEAGKRSQLNAQLKHNYGITLAEKEELFKQQGFACALCGALTPRQGKWDTDHDHGTERVRGIVCHGCNVVCGASGDDPGILRKAADYIERSRIY